MQMRQDHIDLFAVRQDLPGIVQTASTVKNDGIVPVPQDVASCGTSELTVLIAKHGVAPPAAANMKFHKRSSLLLSLRTG